jgi:hypothetical protein
VAAGLSFAGAGVCASAGASTGAMAWGADEYGQLGIPGGQLELRSALLPVAVPGLDGVAQVSAGRTHSLAVTDGGEVLAWGSDYAGQLGNATNTGPETCEEASGTLGACSQMPLPVAGLSGVRAVAAGGAHSLALLEDGTVMAWGENDAGQLGDGSALGPQTCEISNTYAFPRFGCATVPEPVAGLHDVVAIAAGERDSFALLADGTVLAWGEDEFGELGVESAFATGCSERIYRCASSPTPVAHLGTVTAIAAGANHTLALLADGTVMAWGSGLTGELGNGEQQDRFYPVQVSNLSGVAAIAAGNLDSAALLQDGTVAEWGANELGQLGIGNNTGPETCDQGVFTCSTVPLAVPGLSGVQAIAAGWNHTLALAHSGVVMAWGDNNHGELGTGLANPELCGSGSGTRCSTSPVQVGGLTDVTAVSVSAGAADSIGYGPLAPNVTGVTSGGAGGAAARAAGALSPSGSSGSELGGTKVRITGSDLSGASAVMFGEQAAPAFKVRNVAEIVAVSPPGSASVDVTVITPRGASVPEGGEVFTYTAPQAPAVSAVEANQGIEAGGSNVTISGSDLANAAAVRFGAQPATSFTVAPTGTISAVSPPGTGTVDVRVLTPLGESATGSADRFTYVPPLAPTITRLTPAKGSSLGGSQITITGTHFTDVSSVAFGSTSAASFTVSSARSLIATAPPGTAGFATVTVTTAAGATVSSTKDQFRYSNPVIVGITPGAGPRAGGSRVTIVGTGFAPGAGATVFKFGAVLATGVSCSSTTTCTAVTPKASKAGLVTVNAAVGKYATGTKGLRRFKYE